MQKLPGPVFLAHPVFLVTEGLCKYTSGVSACTRLMDECLAQMNCAAASVINAVFADAVNDVWTLEWWRVRSIEAMFKADESRLTSAMHSCCRLHGLQRCPAAESLTVPHH